MAKQKIGADSRLIEKIFDQLSSSVAIALLRDDKLTYEFYGGRNAALPGGAEENGKSGAEGVVKKRRLKQNDGGINRTTRFNIGSASALFTGALTVKLMEFDELRLNDPVSRFVPEFPAGDVTVYHLLTQSSGLSSETLPAPETLAAKREFYRSLYGSLVPAFPAGARCEYYQYNHAILANLLERIAGQTLEELASVLLFMPLGMKYTTYNSASLRDNQFVIPWNHKDNRFMSELHAKQPTGQNGVYTTALDLVRFGRMFINGGEFDGKQVFLESSVEFILREITGGRFMRTPLFMIKRKVDVFGCFSEKLSPDSVALTGNTGCILFIDPVKRAVGAALTNSTWVDSVSQNYSNIIEILVTI